MAEMIRMHSVAGEYSLSQIAQKLQAELPAEVVCCEERLGGRAVLLCFEKYYFRSISYAGLSVLLTEDEGKQDALITGFGGGSGILNISWGANSDFADEACFLLKYCGFALPE